VSLRDLSKKLLVFFNRFVERKPYLCSQQMNTNESQIEFLCFSQMAFTQH